MYRAPLLSAYLGFAAIATWSPGLIAETDPPASNELREQIDLAVQAVYPALVRIHVVSEQGSGGRMQKSQGSGSGTIISEDGIVLTNHHVAGRGTRIVCRLSTREEVDAELIGTDVLSDLSVLRLDLSDRTLDTPLAVASFGDSDKVRVGDTVLAMGSPAGLSQSVTVGVVANTAMIPPRNQSFDLEGESIDQLVRWIGHDAIIFPGNSGGPLVDLSGRIVGVNEVGVGSLGGAIPGNLAKRVADELIREGQVTRSWIGLNGQPLLKDQRRSAQGMLVASVVPDSPAMVAGIQAGDIITSYHGQSLNVTSPEDVPEFNRMVFNTPVGEEITLTGRRQDDELSWTLQTVKREPKRDRPVELKSWGITARNFTRVAALEYRRPDRAGVQIHSSRPGGPASEAKPSLAPGDVILRVGEVDIDDVADLRKATRKLVAGKTDAEPVLVTFDRGSRQYVSVVELGPEATDKQPKLAKKAWLGLGTQVITRELAEALGLGRKKGVRITQVYADTTAAESGLQVGDLLLKLDGSIIQASRREDAEVFDNMIRQYPTDAEITLTGLRSGEDLEITVPLQSRPIPSDQYESYEDEHFEFTVRELAFEDKVSKRLENDQQGLLVAQVERAGWGALAGLRNGDLLLEMDGEAVTSVEEFKKTMESVAESKQERVIFFIKRGIYTAYKELEPDWD